MHEEDKPFVCVKSRWGFNIRPRNAAGWRALGWWLLAFAVATVMHALAILHWADGPSVILATMLYAAFVIGWAINMIRWMLARSVVITRGDPPKGGRR